MIIVVFNVVLHNSLSLRHHKSILLECQDLSGSEEEQRGEVDPLPTKSGHFIYSIS